MTQNKRWIVLADGEHVRFVTPEPARAFRTHRALESEAAHRHSAELGSDRPGRFYQSSTGTRHATAPRQDLHEKEMERFAHHVAQEINGESALGNFDELVLVAPAHTLRHIHEQLDARTREKIVGVLQKDLVKVPDDELVTHLNEWAIED